jgi:hypothetical protein
MNARNKGNGFSSLPAVLMSLALLTLFGAGLSALGTAAPVRAAPPAQIPIYTPTPGPDGRIIYIVQANDTLLGIALLTGVPIEQLRALNNLSSDTIFEGQELLLGLGGPEVVTGLDQPRRPPRSCPRHRRSPDRARSASWSSTT